MAIALAASVTLHPTTRKSFSSVRRTKIWSYICYLVFEVQLDLKIYILGNNRVET